MTELQQTIAAAAVVAGAVAYLLLRGRGKKGSCGKGGCGCTPKGKLP